ncbi:MAG: bifunctional demethylmenaquinone methyltransferase/2-methoxy-6-polyprenyl-1,4-benzoquinol methylase UbiE [Sedimentisphaerales bacterium]|nr:bifunctional demethylmenaquinone methyltransferase/2-methoxy-6-polyprenyl-1,4-benzoquinol methylase UbiE [Sedimentisphaerales bacterium]
MKSVSRQSSENSVGRMFDRIAPDYDKLNHILSFGMDFYWRAKLAGMADRKKQIKVLDLAAGTGDLLIALLRKNPNIIEAVGLDISDNMLAICRKKIASYNLAGRITTICSDVNSSGLPDNTFDIVAMGFGIRNTPDVLKTLSEIYRLLKQSGSALILEFSMPSNKVIKFFYLFYLRYWVPFIGRIISGDKEAYGYLNSSIEKFCNREEFSSLMREAGFQNVITFPLTFGIVCIYKGSKTNM